MKKKILTEQRLCELAGIKEAPIRRTPSGGWEGPTGTLDIEKVEEPVDPEATQAPSTVPSATKEPEMPVALAKKVGRELADWFFTSEVAESALVRAKGLVDDLERKQQAAHHELDPDNPQKDRAAQAKIHALTALQNTEAYHKAEQLYGLWKALNAGVPPVVTKAQELRSARQNIVDAEGLTQAGLELQKVYNQLGRRGLRAAPWARDIY